MEGKENKKKIQKSLDKKNGSVNFASLLEGMRIEGSRKEVVLEKRKKDDKKFGAKENSY